VTQLALEASQAADSLTTARSALQRAEAAFELSASDADWNAILVARGSVEKAERQHRILQSRAEAEASKRAREEDSAAYEKLLGEFEPVLTVEELSEQVRQTALWVKKMREQDARRARNEERFTRLVYLAERLGRAVPSPLVYGTGPIEVGRILNAVSVAVLEALGVPLSMNAARIGVRPEAVASYMQPFSLGADRESRVFADAVLAEDRSTFIDQMLQSVRGNEHGMVDVSIASNDGTTFNMRLSNTVGDDSQIQPQPQTFTIPSSFLNQLKKHPSWSRLKVEVLHVDTPEERFRTGRSTLFRRA